APKLPTLGGEVVRPPPGIDATGEVLAALCRFRAESVTPAKKRDAGESPDACIKPGRETPPEPRRPRNRDAHATVTPTEPFGRERDRAWAGPRRYSPEPKSSTTVRRSVMSSIV